MHVSHCWLGWHIIVSCPIEGRNNICQQNTFANVRHSRSVFAEPVHPWVAAELPGIVLGAHCTCMVGLGEACSHVAAVQCCLTEFTLETEM